MKRNSQDHAKRMPAVRPGDLREFKGVWCNENELICEALKVKLRKKLLPPILDVGAGLGDIAKLAFPDLTATLLDVQPIADKTSTYHRAVTCDFFDYRPDEVDFPNTLLLIHVLQYIDDDIERLQQKIAALNPKVIIAVLNDNTGKFGEIIEWAKTHIPGQNPELHVPLFRDDKYRLSMSVPICAHLSCPTFGVLANQFATVLLDTAVHEGAITSMESMLRSLLASPELEINQTIYCYERAS